MRAAIISDVHGNTVALDAVLDDVASVGPVDTHWFLGDLVAIGPDPVGAAERVRDLRDVLVVRGNTDRYIVTGERPPMPADPVASREFDEGFRWTASRLADAGHLSWIAGIPLERRITLPDGSKVLLVHASPNADDGPGFVEGQTDDEARALLRGCDADVVFVGHTHRVIDRSVAGVRVVNPGPVSNAPPGDLRAAYAVLVADETGYTIELKRIEYDRDAAIAALDASGFPAARFVTRLLRGVA